ncbi:MAG: TIM barrel protein [Chloroflexi bacterium]|nr:TIM barrel protein [Chloroflexota bacterium]
MSKATHRALPFHFGTVGTPLSAPKNEGSAGGVRRIRELNLDALELAWVRGTTHITPEACARVRSAAEECDVAISVHATYFFNLNTQDDEMWQAGRERLLRAARLGTLAGATDVIFHPGSYMKPIEWSRRFENVLPCVDFAHLHARPGDGSFNSYAEFAAALQHIKDGLGNRALQRMHIHLSGIAYTQRGEKNHLNLDESDLHYKDLLRALADFGAAGRILSETPNMEEGAIIMQNAFGSARRRSTHVTT